MKIRPVISMPVMTFLPSVAASSAATSEAMIAANTGATLAQPHAVSHERGVDRRSAGRGTREPFERARIVVQPQRGTRVVERAAAEHSGRRCPHSGVALDLLGAQVRAERDQLGEVVDRLDGAGLLDPDEAV